VQRSYPDFPADKTPDSEQHNSPQIEIGDAISTVT